MQRFLDEVDDDVLCAILSFLSPQDIANCASVSRRVAALCRGDDARLWLSICHRRWGGHTSLKQWINRESGSYRRLYRLLYKWESLIGFWRGVVGSGSLGRSRSQLLFFEWGSRSIQGFRIVPAFRGSFQVKRVPFLWLGASSSGSEVCVLNYGLDGEGNVGSDDDQACICHGSARLKIRRNGDSYQKDEGSSSNQKQSSSENVFAKMDSEWNIEEVTSLGLVPVKVQFVGKNHIVLDELSCTKQVNRKKHSLSEAVAASASFGFNSSPMDEFGTKTGDVESYGKSPPGSFPYEMYQFLSSKVTSPGSERAARKQRRKDKERAENKGRRWLLEQEHFVKVVNSSPTKARPLQGLWKGICQCMGLDFILLSYDEQGGIICRQVGESSSQARSGPVKWTTTSAINGGTPPYNARPHVAPQCTANGMRSNESVPCGVPRATALTFQEQRLYDARLHVAPCDANEQALDEVVGVLGSTRFNLDGNNVGEQRAGRIWMYHSGRFGFGLLQTNFMIDFRLICSRDDHLLDVVD